MNTIHHDPVDDALRSLDAASPLTPDQQARADALLASILATDATGGADGARVVSLRPRRLARWLVPAAAASVLAVGALVWPWNPSLNAAFADWTDTPSSVEPGLLAKATEGCRAFMGTWEVPDAGHARVGLAEQRGSHVFVALRADDGSTAECLVEAENGQVRGGTGGGPGPLAPLGPRDVEMDGPGMQSGPGYAFAFLRGRVGAEVEAVTLHADGRAIHATVANGEFVAWWPTTPWGPDDTLGPLDVTADVTYTDGTVSPHHSTGPASALPAPTSVARVAQGGGVVDGHEVGTIEGLAGENVVAVSVHAHGLVVPATLEDGAFSASWPLPEGVSLEDPAPDVTLTLTLSDGSVIEDVAVTG